MEKILGFMMLYCLFCGAISFLGKTLCEITKYNKFLKFWDKALMVSLISYLVVVVVVIVYLSIIRFF